VQFVDDEYRAFATQSVGGLQYSVMGILINKPWLLDVVGIFQDVSLTPIHLILRIDQLRRFVQARNLWPSEPPEFRAAAEAAGTAGIRRDLR